MRKTFLETQRLLLKEVTPHDTHLFLELDSDPEVMTYLTDGKPSTLEQAQAAMDRIQNVLAKHHHQYGLWFAFEKATDEYMGWFLFRPDKKTPEETQIIELGYRLKRKFWRKGFASEGSEAFLKLGFEKYHLDKIFAITLKDNLGSQGVMKKIGMHWVCDYVENEFPGSNKNAVRFEISKDQYAKRA